MRSFRQCSGNSFQLVDVTAPVFGMTEKAPYAGAGLFVGPNKFGICYNGVLPNGRIVKPAGQTIQVGTNPLGIALSPDGKCLVTSNDDEREGGFTSLQSQINLGSYSLFGGVTWAGRRRSAYRPFLFVPGDGLDKLSNSGLLVMPIGTICVPARMG